MKKLHVETNGVWRLVFCRDAKNNCVITTDTPKNALPSAAHWGQSDLEYFKAKFSNLNFCLQNPLAK